MGIKSSGAVSLTTETVVLMVIAVIALALIWMFFSGYLKFAAFGLEDITVGFKKWFCDDIIKCRLKPAIWESTCKLIC